MKREIKIKKGLEEGTRFRSVYADGNCLFEVVASLGPDAYEAVVVDEPVEINGKWYPGDYAGVTQSFRGEDIRQMRAYLEASEKHHRQNEDYYESLRVGQIVHYHNSFGKFVRCRVTASKDLQPIALVGKWKKSDLPRRFSNGRISKGYYAEKIEAGETMCPDPSNIYENPTFRDTHHHGGIDPGKLYPISLELPGLSPEEEQRIGKVRTLEAIAAYATSRDAIEEPDAAFRAIRLLLGDHNDFEQWRTENSGTLADYLYERGSA